MTINEVRGKLLYTPYHIYNFISDEQSPLDNEGIAISYRTSSKPITACEAFIQYTIMQNIQELWKSTVNNYSLEDTKGTQK